MSTVQFELQGVNGQLFVYEDKVVIERKGTAGFLSNGFASEKAIPMKSIQSVQFREAGKLVRGYIQFGILGGREAQGGTFNAVSDENSVIVDKKDNALAKEIKDYVERMIVENSHSSAAIVQQFSAADEIRKLKELLDIDAITKEEFEAKKKQLLGL